MNLLLAVKTTRIFCRPTCRARKPKYENVVFYDSTQEAINNWFRPCKICLPMELDWEPPVFIKNIIREINENPYLKITDSELKKRKIEPSKIRRWFKKNHNITFHTFQRMLKLNNAYNQIK